MAKKDKNKKTKKEEKDKDDKFHKHEDGTIHIKYEIPFDKIEEKRKEVAQEMGKDIEVSGFRKGKAPLKKIMEEIPEGRLVEETLGRILPKLVAETIKEKDLKPAIYPKFELVSAKEGEPWVIQATTCELPEVKLGNYKKELKDKGKEKAIWTPEKGKEKAEEEEKELTREEKEQIAIEALKDTTKITVPKILIDEEVNSRLSQLLDRVENLGLSLENYLSSIGKDVNKLRDEYEKQAEQAIIIDLALQEVADEENIKVEEEDVEAAIKASSADQNLEESLETPQRKRMIEMVLRKREALNKLVSYIG